MRRRYVLGAMLAVFGTAGAFVLWDVLATVFFAITVSYLLVPIRRRLERRGLSRWGASAGATGVAFLAVLVLSLPVIVVVLLRLNEILSLLATLPESVTTDLFGFTYTVTVEQLLEFLITTIRRLARSAVTSAAVLALKFSVFVLVVFALVSHYGATRDAVFAVVPHRYHDVAEILDTRVRETLFAIYVLQVATATGTFLIGLPFFFLLGYRFFVTLATLSAILQFLPIVGPSLVLAGLAAYHAAVGEVGMALLVLVSGGILVAWLPDILIRPRLARETTGMPGSLYFVGFVGGLLSLGTVGIIAGPLVVALVVTTADLLADELDGDAAPES